MLVERLRNLRHAGCCVRRERLAITGWRTTPYPSRKRWTRTDEAARSAAFALLPDDVPLDEEDKIGWKPVWLCDYLSYEYRIATLVPDRKVRCPVAGCRVQQRMGLSLLDHLGEAHRLTFQQVADIAQRHPSLIFMPRGLYETLVPNRKSSPHWSAFANTNVR